MTRLTLDTIALCGFGYRFNSFYRDTPHPFVEAMVRSLPEAQARIAAAADPDPAAGPAQRQLEEDQAFMNELVDRLIAERRRARRRRRARDTTDLLGRMLTGVDKQTGERLPDDNIRDQCITFLDRRPRDDVAGCCRSRIYYLIKNPDVLARARAEVDGVLGTTAAPDLRAGAAAHLRPAGPRRVAAAVADGAGVHPHALRRTP